MQSLVGTKSLWTKVFRMYGMGQREESDGIGNPGHRRWLMGVDAEPRRVRHL